MTISVIIPIHNAEKTLERSIKSVLAQTIQPSEIICVLNCCTDDSQEILKKFVVEHGNIKILICNEKGIVPALNCGLYNSTGDWIARQDSDDYWFPNKLEKQLEFLQKNPDVQILGTQIQLVTPEKFQPIYSTNHPTDDVNIKTNLLSSSNPIAHPSVIFKREILLRVGGYDDSIPLCEDMALWLKASKWFNFANLSDVLVDYTSTQNKNYTPIAPQLASHIQKLINQYFGKK